jgi:hypothetical protein
MLDEIGRQRPPSLGNKLKMFPECPGNTRTRLVDFLEDRIGDRGPDEASARAIVVLDAGVDFRSLRWQASDPTAANAARFAGVFGARLQAASFQRQPQKLLR